MLLKLALEWTGGKQFREQFSALIFELSQTLIAWTKQEIIAPKILEFNKTIEKILKSRLKKLLEFSTRDGIF